MQEEGALELSTTRLPARTSSCSFRHRRCSTSRTFHLLVVVLAILLV